MATKITKNSKGRIFAIYVFFVVNVLNDGSRKTIDNRPAEGRHCLSYGPIHPIIQGELSA